MSEHDHHHTHDHQHDHDHAHEHRLSPHSHAPANFGKAFAIGIALNAGFVVLEIVFGLLGHSVALLADAGHNLSDVLGLVVAWVASILIKRAPSSTLLHSSPSLQPFNDPADLTPALCW